MKKAQIQIMENIFIIIIIFIILVIALVFTIAMQKNSIIQKKEELKQLEAIRKAKMLNFFPEMQCSDNNNLRPDCYDMLKIEAFMNNQEGYKPLFGNINITIKWFDLKNGAALVKEWKVYDNPRNEAKGSIPAYFPVSLYDPLGPTTHFGVLYIRVYE